ncbi:MAG: hypothetical protein HC923_09155 [Myxococcales bacterium]|nr:hypothetical protein [Myxococcales bacterium]
MSLREETPIGTIVRALAGVPETPDENGNRWAGNNVVAAGSTVRNSVLVDVVLGEGSMVTDSVLIGTRAGRTHADGAFDVNSVAPELRLAPRAGTYRVRSARPVAVERGMRQTSVFYGDEPAQLEVHEDTDLRDRAVSYDVPILRNDLSFRDVHAQASGADPDTSEARSAAHAEKILRALRG